MCRPHGLRCSMHVAQAGEERAEVETMASCRRGYMPGWLLQASRRRSRSQLQRMPGRLFLERGCSALMQCVRGRFCSLCAKYTHGRFCCGHCTHAMLLRYSPRPDRPSCFRMRCRRIPTDEWAVWVHELRQLGRFLPRAARADFLQSVPNTHPALHRTLECDELKRMPVQSRRVLRRLR